MLRALKLAHDSIQPRHRKLQKQMQAELGKAKTEPITSTQLDEALVREVTEKSRRECARSSRRRPTAAGATKRSTNCARRLSQGYLPTEEDEEAEGYARPADVRGVFSDVISAEVRRRIVEDGVRPDGRRLTEIRPLAAEAGIIPRVHGSGLFKRGQTQVLDDCDARHAARLAGARYAQPRRQQALHASLQFPALQHGRNLSAARTETPRDRARRAGGSRAARDDPRRRRASRTRFASSAKC